MPEDGDVIAECADRRAVGRHGVIREESRDDLHQPFPCIGDWPVHALPQLLLDGLKSCTHAVPSRFPLDEESASPRFSADEHETQELEGFRFAKATPLAVLRRVAAELDKTGLVRMKRQRELPQPVAHRIPETPGVALMFKAND
jgi:hypothetical protein